MRNKYGIWNCSLIVMGFVFILANGCKKDDDNIPTALVIGQSYQGGIIAYILQPGDPGYDAKVQHGLIAAPRDQTLSIKWNNGSYTVTAANSTALGTGNDNTATIIASQGEGNYAAKICSDLVLGGYADWYLPSKDELNELYINREAIGGFINDYYWSSSEYNNFNARMHDFVSGSNDRSHKDNTYCVRAVRTF
jgi:hypothetical protein